MSSVLPMKGDRPWPAALTALGVVLAALLWLYRDTGLAMVGIWARSETFTHAFTVPPISLWLIWRRRALLAQMTPRPVPWLLLPMVLVALAWLLGQLATVNAVTQFALVALLVLSVPAVLGWEVARAIQFPLLFLFFAVPFGEFLMPLFMDWTADFTVWALRLSGIPVLREGLQFTIPSGHWSVEAACSGIRYLMASLMVGVLFAYLNYTSMLRRWLFVGISILVPIVANWVRAYLIVLVGHLSGNELATGADHLVYGWVFFGIVILVMLAIGAYWSQPEGAPAAVAPPPPGMSPRSVGMASTLAAAAALAVLALPHGLLARVQGEAPASLHGLETLAAPAAGWAPAAQPPSDWRNAFLNPTQQLQRSYARDGQVVGLQLAYYGSETADSKLVSSTNALVAPQNGQWAQVQTGRQTVQTLGQPLAWRTAELRSLASALTDTGGLRLTVWQIYWINGELIASDARAKAQLAFNRLAGRGSDGAVILIYTVKTSAERDTATLQAFVRDHMDVLTTGLRRARDSAGG
ncbi:exosortase A [Azohydromonas caseinilytica]|uniref:Exosortase A n=1 Tax=Azohydromonas caseinilytica TaxID=2728836 RepID=A0A848F7T2_9BURK|nr:exosortase A [Azohydromonas caseinilytica]NML14403.1 exosortase A [Azohydromonas caseinilytica]